jgi:hypothetical protein
MTDLELFDRIDAIRRVCDEQCINYEFDGAFTRENIAWVFEKARLQIERENSIPKSAVAPHSVEKLDTL